MYADRYTKIVLTIIAASLVILVGQNATRLSVAQTDRPQKVQLCNDVWRCAEMLPTNLYIQGPNAPYGLSVVIQRDASRP